MANDDISGYEDIVAMPSKPHFNNILQKAALQAVRTVANPYQAMVPPEMMNAMATDPGLGGDVGAAGGYALGHPILGGAIGQGTADSVKQLENYFSSGGKQNINLPEIMGQGAIGAGKGLVTKLGVGGVVNLVPGMKNFTVNKLVNSARQNRGNLTKDYGSALDAMDSKYAQAGKYANIEKEIRLAADPQTQGPTSAQQSSANDIIN